MTPGCVKAASQILQNMDNSVDPCDDFYQFACGGFIKKTTIPEDRTRMSSFSVLSDELLSQVRLKFFEHSDTNRLIFFIISMLKNFEIQVFWRLTLLFWNLVQLRAYIKSSISIVFTKRKILHQCARLRNNKKGQEIHLPFVLYYVVMIRLIVSKNERWKLKQQLRNPWPNF